MSSKLKCTLLRSKINSFAQTMLYLTYNCYELITKYETTGVTISKILLIEDNKQNALLIKRVLEVHNHQVVHVDDGEAALTTASNDVPDIILVDLGLPDIDGPTLVGIFKRMPELQHVPLVAVTAWPEDTAREMAEAYGCSGFISKPINTRTFSDQVASFLPKS